LTDTESKPGSESRPIAVVFDEAAKTLTAKDGDHTYSFSKISISNVSINGLGDTVSLGVDRSSFGIVWQQYGGGADKPTTEFGHCQPAAAPG
jgi:phage baseplate assembly protein gpV